MKLRLIISIALISFAIHSKAQSLEYYDLSLKVTYLPSLWPCNQTERYYKDEHREFHVKTKWNNKNCLKNKMVRAKEEFDVEECIALIDSLRKVDTLDFNVSAALIRGLKSKDAWKDTNRITDSYIDSFIHNDTVISIRRIKNIYKDNRFVIDGTPYSMILRYKYKNQDTVTFEMAGNFEDIVLTHNVNSWLVMYAIMDKFAFFNSIEPTKEYFDERLLEIVIYRMISQLKD